MEHENLGVDANGEATSGLNHEGERTNAMPTSVSFSGTASALNWLKLPINLRS